MRRRAFAVCAFAILSWSQAAPARAQEGFTKGYMDVGPTIGLGGLGIGSSIAVGGRLEAAVKSFEVGALGIQASADYYRLDYGGAFGDWSYLPIAVTANYHFAIPNQPKLDPFAGVGIGYLRTSIDCGPLVNCDASGVFTVGHGGIRYFWKPNMAAYADVGVGAASLNVGLMFKLK